MQKRMRMVHVMVWEAHNGPVPDGFDVHHINEDKQDNRVENLHCVSKVEHKRIHGGCTKLADGTWLKPCSDCNVLKPLTDEHWYFNRSGDPYLSRCRPCHIRDVERHRQARLARAKIE